MTSFVLTHLNGGLSSEIWGNGHLKDVRSGIIRFVPRSHVRPRICIFKSPSLLSLVRSLSAYLMAPGKDNLSESYRILLDLRPVLPSKDETICPFRQGKFLFYTRVCNFANYRIPFSVFLIRVLQFFRVHIFQVNPFGLSRVNHFLISCRAQGQRPDLNVFQYFYEFISAGDWYTFAHRKGVPHISRDERSSLKNWKDHFFWLDDRCLPEDMVWRFKDQTMSFDLGDDFVFNKDLARALIYHKSPICPLPEHFLLLGRVCFSWGQGDWDWPVIRMKRGRVEMSLRDALKVPNFNVFDFDLDEKAEGGSSLITQDTSGPTAVEATSSIPTPTKGAAGSSGSQALKNSILDDVDSDPEVRSLDEALQHPPSSASLKSKGIMSDADLKRLVHKRKNETSQILSSDPLPMPRPKKNKRGPSYSTGDVMIELDEHLTGGKFSREEAARTCSAPTPSFSGGFLPVSEVESMEMENPETTGKGDEKSREEPKMVTFSGTNLDSSLGPDRFIDDEEDQVSSLPSSWSGPELMSFLRYADVFSDDMEIDPATTEEKFILDWDIRNKDLVKDELVARTLLFNISTPLDHARSRRMKNQDLGAMVLSNQAQSNIFVT
ncbi:hypothetical protein Hanom_Chr14g01305511 [Helianthus anomalus]